MTPAAAPQALLPNEPVLLVQARLARALGLAPALFLQQVHYWLQRSHHEHAGRPWIYNTYRQWQEQLGFLSADQIARAVGTLRRLGVLLVAHLDSDRRERRNWYSIDYLRLAAILAAAEPPAAAPMDAESDPSTSDPNRTPVPDRTPVPGPRPPVLEQDTVTEAAASGPDQQPGSARSCGAHPPTMPQIRGMHVAPAGSHPEITPPEISPRLPQEEPARGRAGPTSRPHPMNRKRRLKLLRQPGPMPPGCPRCPRR